MREPAAEMAISNSSQLRRPRQSPSTHRPNRNRTYGGRVSKGYRRQRHSELDQQHHPILKFVKELSGHKILLDKLDEFAEISTLILSTLTLSRTYIDRIA